MALGSLKKGSLLRGENTGSGTAKQVALLSITTAPSGTFAVGSKYYDSTEKKIYTAVTVNTWTGATSADPVFNVIYTYDSGYYIWDGDNLVSTDVDAFIKGATVNGVSVVDANKIAVIPNASNSVIGAIKIATDAEVAAGTAENLAVNPKQLKDGLAAGTAVQTSEFVKKDSVLSSSARCVCSNSQFFIYSNGDVSEDGKTILKSNTLTALSGEGITPLYVRDSIASEDYYIQVIAYSYEGSGGEIGGAYMVYSITKTGENKGTLTYIGRLTFPVEKVIRLNNMSYGNGIFVLPNTWDGENIRGYSYISESNITGLSVTNYVSSPTTLSKVIWSSTQNCWITGYNFEDWTVRYIYSADIATLMSSGTVVTISHQSNKHVEDVFEDSDGKLYFVSGRDLGQVDTFGSEGSWTSNFFEEWTGTNNVNKKLIKIDNYYYCIDAYIGYIQRTNSMNVVMQRFAQAYNVKGIAKLSDTNAVITMDSSSILFMGLDEIVYSDFQKLNFTQITPKTIVNDTTEISIVDYTDAIGDLVIPANSLKVGDVIKAEISGQVSTASSAPTATLRIKLGSVTLVTNAGLMTASLSNVFFMTKINIVIRAIGATGKAILRGNTLFKDDTTISAGQQRALKGAEVEINTTKDNLLDATYQWSVASTDNSITVEQNNVKIETH